MLHRKAVFDGKLQSSPSATNPATKGELLLRGQRLVWGERTYIMGVVNVTPDSFSGDGICDADEAVARALELIEQGADLIDLGGESTRPGHTPVDSQTEIERVVTAIGAFRKRSNAIISVDTYKVDVFQAAHAAGADMLNSVWGLTDALLQAAIQHDVPIVITHNKEKPEYNNVVDEVLSYLYESASKAVSAGLKKERVILDPGIGFGKSAEHNLEVLGSLSRFTTLGFPTLIGTSRKSTIGKVTGKDVTDRVFGTAATVALAVAAGIDIVRVHDVSAMLDVVKMSDAIVRRWRPSDWSRHL
jgi:dihydropteroate synthase